MKISLDSSRVSYKDERVRELRMNTRDDQSELFPIVDQYVTASEVERVLREALELAKKGARHE